MALAIRSLCKAARIGDVESIERYLSMFPEHLNERNKDGRTALIVAVRHSQASVVKYLLDHDASVNESSSRSGASPVWHCSWKGDVTICKLLLDRGADAMSEAQDCGTPLMVASQYGHLQIISCLLDHGVDIDQQQQRFNCTSLWWSCRSNHPDIVALLIKRGADLTIKDWKGRTPADIARNKAHHECFNLLQEAMRAMTLYKMRTLYDARQCNGLLPRARTRRSTQESKTSHLPACLKKRIIAEATANKKKGLSGKGDAGEGAGGDGLILPDVSITAIPQNRKKRSSDAAKQAEKEAEVAKYVIQELPQELFVELMAFMP